MTIEPIVPRESRFPHTQPLLKVLERLYEVTIPILSREAVAAGFRGVPIHCEGRIEVVQPVKADSITLHVVVDDRIPVFVELPSTKTVAQTLVAGAAVKVVGLLKSIDAGVWLDEATITVLSNPPGRDPTIPRELGPAAE